MLLQCCFIIRTDQIKRISGWRRNDLLPGPVSKFVRRKSRFEETGRSGTMMRKKKKRKKSGVRSCERRLPWSARQFDYPSDWVFRAVHQEQIISCHGGGNEEDAVASCGARRNKRAASSPPSPGESPSENQHRRGIYQSDGEAADRFTFTRIRPSFRLHLVSGRAFIGHAKQSRWLFIGTQWRAIFVRHTARSPARCESISWTQYWLNAATWSSTY